MNEATHVIITYTGTHYIITAVQELKLRELKADQQIRIGQNTIKARNIAEVIEIEKYYETHPNKRPPIISPAKQFPGVGIERTITNEKRVKVLEGFKKGLLKHMTSEYYQGLDAPKDLLRLCENKIKECKYSTQPTQ